MADHRWNIGFSTTIAVASLGLMVPRSAMAEPQPHHAETVSQACNALLALPQIPDRLRASIQRWSELSGLQSWNSQRARYVDLGKYGDRGWWVLVEKENREKITLYFDELDAESKARLREMWDLKHGILDEYAQRTSVDGRPRSSSESGSKQASTVRTYPDLVERSKGCDSAKEVVRLYGQFLDDTTIPTAERELAQKALIEWKQRAEQELIRFGSQWLPAPEVDKRRKVAKDLISEALRMIEIGQGDQARERMREASKTDPESIEADFLLGLGYALIAHDAKGAEKHFSECASRDPTHVGALNNLALAQVRLGQFDKALRAWKKALLMAPATPEALQNLGRFVDLANRRRIVPSKEVVRQSTEFYAAVAASVRASQFDPKVGWLYLRYYPGKKLAPKSDATKPTPATPDATPKASTATDKAAAKAAPKANAADKAAPARITIGNGSGFVAAPHYIVTNRHVVERSHALLVAAADRLDEQHPATVVAVSDLPDVDLAILRCDTLDAPPVRFSGDEAIRRGAEVMVLGFPPVSGFRHTLKSTRGTVSGLSADPDGSFLMDVIANPGNSGGPICDSTGSVLGALYAGTTEKGLLFQYTLGVPHRRIVALLNKAVPGYERERPRTETLEWTKVDALASASTVLVLIQQNLSNAGLPKALPREREGVRDHVRGEAFEDPWCMQCGGLGTVRCPNRTCARGTVGSRRFEEMGRNPVTGQAIGESVPIRVTCPTCNGNARVRCQFCTHGIDRDLLN